MLPKVLQLHHRQRAAVRAAFVGIVAGMQSALHVFAVGRLQLSFCRLRQRQPSVRLIRSRGQPAAGSVRN